MGKPVIQWVYEKAKQSKLADLIIVATDDKRIYDCVKSFGGEVEMTSVEHKCGSDRIMEVVSRHPEISYICNLQGDEPLIKPESIDAVIKNVKDDDIKSTLITKYGKVIANDIIEDMHSPEDIFRYYDFSRHFDWKNMDVNKNSYFLRILALDKKLKNAIVNNPIKQGDLEKIFE